MDQQPPAGDPQPAAQPPGPAWGQPAQPPAPGPAWGQPAQPVQPAAPPAPGWGQPQQQAPGPAWGQPAQQPAPTGWAQPAPAQGWVVPTAAPAGPVTGLAKLAGVVLLVFGLIWTGLGGLITFVGGAAKVGSSSTALPEFVNSVGDVVAGFGIVILVIAIIEIIGAVGVLLSKGWGRVIGIIYSLIFGLGSVFIVLGGMRANDVTDTSSGGTVTLVIGLVFLIGYVYALFTLGLRWRGRPA